MPWQVFSTCHNLDPLHQPLTFVDSLGFCLCERGLCAFTKATSPNVCVQRHPIARSYYMPLNARAMCPEQAENALKLEYVELPGPSPEELKRQRLKEMEVERGRQVGLMECKMSVGLMPLRLHYPSSPTPTPPPPHVLPVSFLAYTSISLPSMVGLPDCKANTLYDLTAVRPVSWA